MKTTVIHLHDAPTGWESDPRYVYIGRQVGRGRNFKLPGSPFANPITLKECGGDREICLGRFRTRLLADPEWLRRVLAELPGKILVCWCKPALCHGDVYLELIEPRVTDAQHLVLWTIFRSPQDYPDQIVLRKFVDGVPQELCQLFPSLEEARRAVPAGLVPMPRDVADHSSVVESWI